MFVILKPDRDTDMYVEWSTGADGPTFAGDRDATLAHISLACWLDVDGYRPADRLARADEYGTSARPGGVTGDPGWGDWTQPGFICDQRWLPRDRLGVVADRVAAGQDILDLTDEILDDE